MLKKIVTGLVIVLIIIQFFQPDKNESNDQKANISTKYAISDEVSHILENACNDCHSNQTNYPFYAHVQPVGWWLNGHVEEGKEHLNFSEFTNLSIADQNHQFEEIVEVIEENEMPLESYTYLGLHPEASLSDKEKTSLITWAKEQMSYLKSNYPADSLKRKKRGEQHH
ncbi:heme-binding domain-containing protein [Echinicola jeungdonensis]|uniref:Heme-binding domain-containing protein n=1 Tax=Echinicola jeungdonensis TaxID=709343 RepID=A0ABV5JAA4_9BACT|nr:heme-binding domain-containing protein [Echinicola jeungdonensis]MDN3669466.1 heme-binding domain-containing protein [Echinicola jeungdonensis]